MWKFIESQCGAKNVEEFQQLPRPDQKAVIFNAHEEGVGPRTLSRLTGVPYTIVQRATSNKDASFISRQHGSVCDSNPDDEEYLKGPVPLIPPAKSCAPWSKLSFFCGYIYRIGREPNLLIIEVLVFLLFYICFIGYLLAPKKSLTLRCQI